MRGYLRRNGTFYALFNQKHLVLAKRNLLVAEAARRARIWYTSASCESMENSGMERRREQIFHFKPSVAAIPVKKRLSSLAGLDTHKMGLIVSSACDYRFTSVEKYM